MLELILNIYIIIEKYKIIGFKAISYELDGDDDDKIKFLKSRVTEDYQKAKEFSAPTNRFGQFMEYKKFAKLEEQGMHFQLFENIFSYYDVPERPLVCVTPVMDGEILN